MHDYMFSIKILYLCISMYIMKGLYKDVDCGLSEVIPSDYVA